MLKHYAKISAVTPPVKVGDCSYNVEQISRICAEAGEDINMLVFPELALTGASCGDMFNDSVLIDSAMDSLYILARNTTDNAAIIVVGLPVMFRGNLYNCAAVLKKGRIIGIVPKSYARNSKNPNTRWFASGENIVDEHITRGLPFSSELVFRAYDMKGLTFGILIGSDVLSSGAFEALCAKGVTTIVCIAADTEVSNKRNAVLKKAAILSEINHCGVVYTNAGMGESTTDSVYAAGGYILEAGEIIARRSSFVEGFATGELDVNYLTYRRLKNAYICPDRGMEVDISAQAQDFLISRVYDPDPFVPKNHDGEMYMYESILKTQAYALKKRMDYVGARKLVVGVSGGLDSTLALIAAVNAVKIAGRTLEDIVPISMPGFGTTQHTRANAESLCAYLGLSLRTIDITAAVNQHFRDIGHSGNEHDIAFENAQARERTQILMDVANRENGMVVGTGDMSELALGWATYNGDHMSMYSVNSGIPKTVVRRVVRFYANTCGKEGLAKCLVSILDTPISPELVPGAGGAMIQKTEDIIGPYVIHDFFLYYMLERGFGPQKLYSIACTTFSSRFDDLKILEMIEIFYKRFFTQQYKRSCMPDGPAVLEFSLSPRGAFVLPSDIQPSMWLRELDEIKKMKKGQMLRREIGGSFVKPAEQEKSIFDDAELKERSEIIGEADRNPVFFKTQTEEERINEMNMYKPAPFRAPLEQPAAPYAPPEAPAELAESMYGSNNFVNPFGMTSLSSMTPKPSDSPISGDAMTPSMDFFGQSATYQSPDMPQYQGAPTFGAPQMPHYPGPPVQPYMQQPYPPQQTMTQKEMPPMMNMDLPNNAQQANSDSRPEPGSEPDPEPEPERIDKSAEIDNAIKKFLEMAAESDEFIEPAPISEDENTAGIEPPQEPIPVPIAPEIEPIPEPQELPETEPEEQPAPTPVEIPVPEPSAEPEPELDVPAELPAEPGSEFDEPDTEADNTGENEPAEQPTTIANDDVDAPVNFSEMFEINLDPKAELDHVVPEGFFDPVHDEALNQVDSAQETAPEQETRSEQPDFDAENNDFADVVNENEDTAESVNIDVQEPHVQEPENITDSEAAAEDVRSEDFLPEQEEGDLSQEELPRQESFFTEPEAESVQDLAPETMPREENAPEQAEEIPPSLEQAEESLTYEQESFAHEEEEAHLPQEEQPQGDGVFHEPQTAAEAEPEQLEFLTESGKDTESAVISAPNMEQEIAPELMPVQEYNVDTRSESDVEPEPEQNEESAFFKEAEELSVTDQEAVTDTEPVQDVALGSAYEQDITPEQEYIPDNQPEQAAQEETFYAPQELQEAESFFEPQEMTQEQSFFEPQEMAQEQSFSEPQEQPQGEGLFTQEQPSLFADSEKPQPEDFFMEPELIAESEHNADAQSALGFESMPTFTYEEQPAAEAAASVEETAPAAELQKQFQREYIDPIQAEIAAFIQSEAGFGSFMDDKENPNDQTADTPPPIMQQPEPMNNTGAAEQPMFTFEGFAPVADSKVKKEDNHEVVNHISGSLRTGSLFQQPLAPDDDSEKPLFHRGTVAQDYVPIVSSVQSAYDRTSLESPIFTDERKMGDNYTPNFDLLYEKLSHQRDLEAEQLHNEEVETDGELGQSMYASDYFQSSMFSDKDNKK